MLHERRKVNIKAEKTTLHTVAGEPFAAYIHTACVIFLKQMVLSNRTPKYGTWQLSAITD